MNEENYFQHCFELTDFKKKIVDEQGYIGLLVFAMLLSDKETFQKQYKLLEEHYNEIKDCLNNKRNCNDNRKYFI